MIITISSPRLPATVPRSVGSGNKNSDARSVSPVTQALKTWQVSADRNEPHDRKTMIVAAAASSLKQVAWGFAGPDFWKFFIAAAPATYGRGVALEAAWKKQLVEQKIGTPPTIGDVYAGETLRDVANSDSGR